MRDGLLQAEDAGLRPSGLPVAEQLPWGTHICQFYRDRGDLATTLVPFFKAGLLGNERCLWICSEPLTALDGFESLAAEVPDLAERLRCGQMEIFDHKEWYLRLGQLGPERVLGEWLRRESEAREAGYAGLRLSGNTSWLDRKHWASFSAYEASVHATFHARRIIAVCSYAVGRCSSEEIVDVMRNHSFALVRRENAWHSLHGSTSTLAGIGQGGDGSGPASGDFALEPRAMPLEGADPAIVAELEQAMLALESEASERRRLELQRSHIEEAERSATRLAQLATEHLAQLQRFTSALSEAKSASEITSRVLAELRQTFAADVATVALAPEEGEELWLYERSGTRSSGAQAALPISQLARDASEPVAVAIRTGRPIWLNSRQAVQGAFPELDTLDGPVCALGCMPLSVGSQRLGALKILYRTEYEVPLWQRALLEDYATQVALAVSRAQSYEQAQRARTRLEILADASNRIARAKLDLQQVLETVVHEIARPGFADSCVINLLADDGQTAPVAAMHFVDARAGAAALDALTASPVVVGSGIVGGALQSGQTVRTTGSDTTFASAASTYRPHLRDFPVSSLVAVPLRASGAVMGALTASRSTGRVFTEADQQLLEDLSARAALSIENARLYERAQKERERAEQERSRAQAANRAKDEFLAMLGHELRNPLSPTLTALQLMTLQGSDAYAKERSIIERQVKHMVRLVDDLLDVSRITRGKVRLRRQRVELATVVTSAIEVAGPFLEERGQRLHLSVPATGLLVEADPDRLAQVLGNLLSNASKYSPESGSIWIGAALVEAGDKVRLSVRDQGAGIEPELLPHIFDLFAQGKQASDRAQGGLGLGLAIARNLVQLHGGRLFAASEGLGKGSVFTVELSVLGRTRSGHMPAVRSSRAPAVPATVKQRVLIVDDNVDAAEAMRDVLSFIGHTVRIAHDGPSALELAAAFAPELALLDIGLPVMDGYELGRRLRELLAGSPPRIIAVTGYGHDTDKQRSAEAGFDEHLVKPVYFEQLDAVIQRLFPRGEA